MDDGGLFDDMGPEELGMALGLGEEIGLGEQEDRKAARENENEPISLQDYKLPGPNKGGRRHAKPARRGSFEAWVRGVISGEIDPNDVDQYPLFNDPI
ncbi:hypothetical protein DRO91_07995 [Candidatus Heimdallarchaeota archaeon]|nr:MAG: hypothetical protein DRO91_07995 [Candidatus Heimdallarchaeota archaeon]